MSFISTKYVSGTLCRLTFLFFFQSLADALKKALKGDLENVVLALLMTPPEYDAFEMKRAMKVLHSVNELTKLTKTYYTYTTMQLFCSKTFKGMVHPKMKNNLLTVLSSVQLK